MSTNLGTMKRGDTKTVQFTADGSKLPTGGLTVCSLWFTAKQQVTDADASAVIHKTGIAPSGSPDFTIVTAGDPTTNPPTNGVAKCVIQPVDTSSLPDYNVVLDWDFQLKDASGNVTTSADGTLTVQPDITRAS